ncbi:MAG: ATP-binding protein [Chloroflexi bacterium]|nr:ATP-binding protein [Chloroflexota bacterium]
MNVTAVLAPYADSQSHLLAGLSVLDWRVQWAIARARANGLQPDDEFRGLYISDDHADALLSQGIGGHIWANGSGRSMPTALDFPAALDQARHEWQARAQASRADNIPLRLNHLAAAFGLTPIEVDALLIALAPEIDPRYERLYAYLQDDVTRKRPTIDLALNLLTTSFREKLQQRQLFAENGRLLAHHLLICFHDGPNSAAARLAHFLRPAPSVVEFLLDDDTLDPQLTPAAALIAAAPTHPPQRVPADLLRHLQQAASHTPLFLFTGRPGTGKQEAAHHLAHAANQPLLTFDFAALAQTDLAADEGLRLALRDGRLHQAMLYLTGWEGLLTDDGRLPARLFSQLLVYPHTIVLAGELNWQADGERERPLFPVVFPLPDYGRRLDLWRAQLGDGLPPEAIASQFRFTPGQIEAAAAAARDLARWRGEPLSESDLFAAARAHSNQRLAALAVKIRPRYTWDDIILPADTLAQLHEMVSTVRQRPTVYGAWGFDRKLALGKGLNALFAGESGTGKTMAADVMAGALGLDLYKIDLSALVSKYIGETEKNLDRIFTEAATSNAILFFDEADAIFGKRSEVKDSHDRYANIEISYLLQRMEAYDGVVILATNLRANLDDAFTRRLHFAIEFPFPQPADRERIWRVNVPPETPMGDDVDWPLLAERFELAGGSIRNIILAAAFLAAEENAAATATAVHLRHLLHAARREYQKMGRLIEERLFERNP